MVERKYICKMCNKSLEEMPDAILVKVVIPEEMKDKWKVNRCDSIDKDKKPCPCDTGEFVVFHLKYRDVHFLSDNINTGNHCSTVPHEYLEPARPEDMRKKVVYLL